MRQRVTHAGGGYDVLAGPGLLARAREHLSPLLEGRGRVVVADQAVAEAYAAPLARDLDAPLVEVPSGEGSKSFRMLAELCERLSAHGLDRRGVVIAVGGGVTGDLAGLAAAIYKRGVDYIQVPTTLLAQVDSSVGGKTAIDTPAGKNLVGAFHQPILVLADLDTLASLPERHLRAGYAEVMKHGLLGDADFFTWLEAEGDRVLSRESAALQRAVVRCIELKAEIVAGDERDTAGVRARLNLGHTFAHALEAEAGYGEAMLHGEAVAIGCVLAFRLAARLGRIPSADAERVGAAIAAAGLPHRLPAGLKASTLIRRMARDKKVEDGGLVFILPRAIGDAEVVRGLSPGEVKDFLIAEGALP